MAPTRQLYQSSDNVVRQLADASFVCPAQFSCVVFALPTLGQLMAIVCMYADRESSTDSYQV